MTAAPAAALAVVLYAPEEVHLARMLSTGGEAGWRVFAFVNGEVDEGCEALLSRLPASDILRSPVNVGLAAGLNALADRAAAEGLTDLLILDQDSEPGPGLIAALRPLLRLEGPPVAAAGPRLVAPEGEGYLAPRVFARGSALAEAVQPVDYLPTSGTLLSLAAWREVGPFREDFIADAVDIEWGLRAGARGYRCLMAGDVAMVHRWGGVSADRSRPQILRLSVPRAYLYVRNTVALIGLGHVGPRWRAMQGLNLARNLAVAAMHPEVPDRGPRLKAMWRALRDGLAGRLGPVPPL